MAGEFHARVALLVPSDCEPLHLVEREVFLDATIVDYDLYV